MRGISCASPSLGPVGLLRGLLAAAAIAALPLASADAASPFLAPQITTSTVPANMDANPYGVALVPDGFPTGTIQAGEVLVSNFNNSAGIMGLGSTVIWFNPNFTPTNETIQAPGTANQFLPTQTAALPFTGPDLALGILRAGYVVVGMVPTVGGTPTANGTPQPGGLAFFDQFGNPVTQMTGVAGGPLDGPWGLTIFDETSLSGGTAQIFVSNLLNGTVARIPVTVTPGRRAGTSLSVGAPVEIASGYTAMPNNFLGPAGLAYDETNQILYVNSMGDNAIFAVANPLTLTKSNGPGTVVFQNTATFVPLDGPIGLVFLDPATGQNGDLLAANVDAPIGNVTPDPTHPSEINEINPMTGTLVKRFNVDVKNGGAFGLNLGIHNKALRFGFVDDNQATLTVYGCPLKGC